MPNVIPTPTTLLADLATDLLRCAEQTLLDNNLPLPSHRFLSWHEPAWDCCDHLVVHWQTVQLARGMRRTRSSASQGGPPLTVLETDIVLTYIGCAATGDPMPTDAQISENAAFMYQQAWTIYQGIACYFVPNSLSLLSDACTFRQVIPLEAKIPQGGCEAFTCGVTVQIS